MEEQPIVSVLQCDELNNYLTLRLIKLRDERHIALVDLVKSLNLVSNANTSGIQNDWVKVSSELAVDRRAWSASIRDVVNSIGDAGSIRIG